MNFDVFPKKEGAVELCVLLLVVHEGGRVRHRNLQTKIKCM